MCAGFGCGYRVDLLVRNQEHDAPFASGPKVANCGVALRLMLGSEWLGRNMLWFEPAGEKGIVFLVWFGRFE